MPRLFKVVILSILVALTSGCAFAPRTSAEQPYANSCNMSTKMMTLDKPRATQAFGCQKSMNGAEFLSCLMVAGVIVPAGSFIISGSIVLINNTMHWLEYQGTCDKAELEKHSQTIRQKTAKPAN